MAVSIFRYGILLERLRCWYLLWAPTLAFGLAGGAEERPVLVRLERRQYYLTVLDDPEAQKSPWVRRKSIAIPRRLAAAFRRLRTVKRYILIKRRFAIVTNP